MPTDVSRSEVTELLDSGGQLIDVLPADEYAEQHLAGAVSIPLKTLDAAATAALSRSRPIIVYCHDLQ